MSTSSRTSMRTRRAAWLAAAVAGGMASSRSPSCQVTSVAEKALPSVVTIRAKGTSSSGTGSGEIMKSDGYILTNNHVIAPAASGGTLAVLFSDGKTAPATLVGPDPLTDVAVIKVLTQGLNRVGLADAARTQPADTPRGRSFS